MNTLSWLLWLADVSGSLSSFFGIVCIPIFIALLVFIIGGYVSEHDGRIELAARMKKVGFGFFLPLFFVCAIISCILPSKDTVYLIAASEAGEAAITSPTGQRALAAVNRYLDSVAEDKEEEKTNN